MRTRAASLARYVYNPRGRMCVHAIRYVEETRESSIIGSLVGSGVGGSGVGGGGSGGGGGDGAAAVRMIAAEITR